MVSLMRLISKVPFHSYVLLGAMLSMQMGLPACAAEGEVLQRGQKVFESHLCAECHKGGLNSVRPSKPISGKKFALKYKDDAKLISVIRNGVPNASMPSFGPAVISDEEMKDLVVYVRSFTPPQDDKKRKTEKVRKSEKPKSKRKKK